MTGNIDILLISETKLNQSFPIGHVIIGVIYTLLRCTLHCRSNANGRGIVLFVKKGIPSKLLSIEIYPTEVFFVEINLRTKKGLLSSVVSTIQIEKT